MSKAKSRRAAEEEAERAASTAYHAGVQPARAAHDAEMQEAYAEFAIARDRLAARTEAADTAFDAAAAPYRAAYQAVIATLPSWANSSSQPLSKKVS